MNLLTSDDSPNLTRLLAAVVAAFVVASAVGFALDLPEGNKEPRSKQAGRRNPRVEPDEPDIVQAPWKLVAYPASSPGKATPKQKKAVKKAATKVKNVVRDLYDALTISRGQLKEVSARLMPEKARDTLRARPLVPFSLSAIKTLRREGRIAIDLTTRTSASAKVQLSFRADEGKKRLFLSHEGTLWLERGKDGWQIIAFNLDQRARA